MSRLILGGNAISGNSHSSVDLDNEMIDYFSAENTKELFRECERNGINAVQARGDSHIMRLFEQATHSSRFDRLPLVTTDGYRYYRIVLGRLLGRGCVHGRVVKTYRKSRVTKVERDLSIGSEWQLQHALARSEDSDRLNTSFVERLNLTIPQGSAYLQRRSPAHARFGGCLADHLELLRCYYNFIRPHMALRFGREARTPAMQAGLVDRKLTFRDVFTAVATFFSFLALFIRVRCPRQELSQRFIAA